MHQHKVLKTSMHPPFPTGCELALFAMGCFWGVEKLYWPLAGVYTTMVGYTGGHTANPDYHAVCSGETGHCEAVRIVYYPEQISYQDLLAIFWTKHDPTQGMRQGNDIGSQYRSAIYCHTEEQYSIAQQSRQHYQAALQTAGLNKLITTEIGQASEFYYGEHYHQQYLFVHPDGYCGLAGTGVAYQ